MAFLCEAVTCWFSSSVTKLLPHNDSPTGKHALTLRRRLSIHVQSQRRSLHNTKAAYQLSFTRLCNQLTSDDGVVAAPVKEYASRRRRTTVDLVSLNVVKGKLRWWLNECERRTCYVSTSKLNLVRAVEHQQRLERLNAS